MNHMTVRLTSAICFLVMVVSTVAFPQAKLPTPPPTRQDNVRETIHGVEIIDPYRWLEDQQSEETRNWVAEENAYTHSPYTEYPGNHDWTFAASAGSLSAASVDRPTGNECKRFPPQPSCAFPHSAGLPTSGTGR